MKRFFLILSLAALVTFTLASSVDARGGRGGGRRGGGACAGGGCQGCGMRGGCANGRCAAQEDDEDVAQARPARLTVRLPADAMLQIEGQETESTGSIRHFQTPAIEPGEAFTYELSATLADGGRAIRRQVTVHAGERRAVSFVETAQQARND
jgi:uncharacterized protein (TIGR03000 family)